MLELLPRRGDFGGLLRPDLAVVSLYCDGVWIWPSQVQLAVVVCSRECVDGFMMASIGIGGFAAALLLSDLQAGWLAEDLRCRGGFEVSHGVWWCGFQQHTKKKHK